MSAPTYSHGLPGYLADDQIEQLLKAINPLRVSQDPKGNSHVEAYEIRAHLSRIFGVGRWDENVVDQHVVYESSFEEGKKDKYGQPVMRWSACWYARVTLTIRTPDGQQLCQHTEGATGDATNQVSRADAHDQACKTAASQAFKRCAMNLGDQFGLSLYNKGSKNALVRRMLIAAPPEAATNGAAVDAHITTPLAPEGETENSQRETSSPPPSKGPAPKQEPAPSGGEHEAGTSPAAEQPPAGGPDPDATPAPGPAMDGHDDPAAAPTPAPEPSQPSPASGSEPTSGNGEAAWEHVLGILAGLRLQSPADALVSLNGAMEIAVRHRLRGRIVPDTNVTLAALLTQRMAQASAAKANREREEFVAAAAEAEAARRNGATVPPIEF